MWLIIIDNYQSNRKSKFKNKKMNTPSVAANNVCVYTFKNATPSLSFNDRFFYSHREYLLILLTLKWRPLILNWSIITNSCVLPTIWRERIGNKIDFLNRNEIYELCDGFVFLKKETKLLITTYLNSQLFILYWGLIACVYNVLHWGCCSCSTKWFNAQV